MFHVRPPILLNRYDHPPAPVYSRRIATEGYPFRRPTPAISAARGSTLGSQAPIVAQPVDQEPTESHGRGAAVTIRAAYRRHYRSRMRARRQGAPTALLHHAESRGPGVSYSALTEAIREASESYVPWSGG